jgi:signal transduction histidine kinase/ActR/RegA family two-component response regulator
MVTPYFQLMIVIHRKITWLFAFSIFSLGLASWLILLSKKNLDESGDRLNLTYETVSAIQQLEYSLAMAAPAQVLQQEADTLSQLAHGNGGEQTQIAALKHALAQPVIDRTSTFTLLATMLREQKNLLNTRIHENQAVRQKTAYLLIVGRVGAGLFVLVLLVQLNNDITRRKKIQKHLEKAILESQAARQMQEQFLANMSHEIRTPMNGIKGMTDLLLDTPLSQKQQELAGTIKSAANNLLVIINDILDFSKIKAGKLNIEKIEFALKDILTNISSIFEHRIKKKGLRLDIVLSPDIPGRLIGDPYRLNQILINLVGNATKFTEEGHIEIKVDVQKKTEQEVHLTFSVTDTGIGIAPESLPHIFESFSQAGEGGNHRYGGTGLGLTICKQLLHLQGGDITATSTRGTGSAFRFHLPYAYTDRLVYEPSHAAVHIQDFSNLLTGRRFLVAEDNEINQRLIDYVLTRAGGTVQLAGNGVQAIEHLRDDKAFDLIIMDLQMPEMDGYETTEYIRKTLQLNTPIIAMTATAMAGEHLQCLRAGMNEYMTKPFEFADLYKRIAVLLSYEHPSLSLYSGQS